jgi:hypothetical protein
MEMTATILAPILLALATAFFTARFYFYQATADLKSEYQRRFNERKWETYTAFAKTVKGVFTSTRAGRVDRDLPKHIAQLEEFVSDLWLVGSDDVVRRVLKWRHTSQAASPGKESLLDLAEILIAMRRDLGDTSTKIEGRDLLALFVNDIDTVFPRR